MHNQCLQHMFLGLAYNIIHVVIIENTVFASDVWFVINLCMVDNLYISTFAINPFYQCTFSVVY